MITKRSDHGKPDEDSCHIAGVIAGLILAAAITGAWGAFLARLLLGGWL